MAFNEIPLILSILAAMISIPFAASTIDYINEAPGLAVILNTTPEFISNSSIPSMISKTVTDDGILYLYRTPYGEYTILISPEKFEQTLLKIGKRVSTTQKSTEQFWELSLPSESLKINHSEQKVVETYRIINGYLKLTTENGYTKTEKSGTATQEELKAGMENLEKELNQTINHMKEMSEQILNVTVTEEPEVEPSTQNITINELLPDPDGTSQDYNDDNTTSDAKDEFIEIYNSGDTSISLTNWLLISGSSTLVITDVTIPAKGFVYFVAGNKTSTINGSSGWSGSWTTLSNGGDNIILKDDSGTTVDDYTYTDSSAGRSIGRLPDGSGNWEPSMPPSPGEMNI